MSNQLSFTQALRENAMIGENTNEETKNTDVEPKTTEKETVVNTSDDVNVIYIGNKPVMNYVLSIVTLINNGSSKISIKSRGKAINRAVDVAEVVRHRFVTDINVEDIKIATEELIRDDGNTSNVSTMEIILSL